jgi:tetratricopeptide (TPR) repeat protein
VSDGYTILTLDEVETASNKGSSLIPVRHMLGFQPAGVNAWIADSGGQLIPPHEEDSGNEELYVVVRGRAAFTVGEETADAPAGTFVFVPPEVYRTAAAEEDATIVLAVGGTIGEAFNAGGWEAFSLADTHRQAGRYEEGRAIMAQLIAENPDYWATTYNAGCFESLAGNPDAAFEHLRRAKELDAEGDSAQYFLEDSDLDPIRDDPRFQELLG